MINTKIDVQWNRQNFKVNPEFDEGFYGHYTVNNQEEAQVIKDLLNELKRWGIFTSVKVTATQDIKLR